MTPVTKKEKKKRQAFELTLPYINLKYFGPNEKGEKPVQKDMQCFLCKKQGIVFGGVRDGNTPHPKFICEDCAINEFQRDGGFVTRKAAAARRRRIFDVPYLFQEILTDEYMKRKKVLFETLGEAAIEQLFSLSNEIYNSLFGKEMKFYLEEMVDQEELEIIFRNFIERTPDDLFGTIHPHSKKSFLFPRGLDGNNGIFFDGSINPL